MKCLFIISLLAIDALMFAMVAGAIWKEHGIQGGVVFGIFMMLCHIAAIVDISKAKI